MAAPTRIASPITSVIASGWPSMVRAATQLVSTIIAPTDRSMPPAMTITAWATARKANGRPFLTMEVISKVPNRGINVEYHATMTTSSSHTPAVQPWAPNHRRTSASGT